MKNPAGSVVKQSPDAMRGLASRLVEAFPSHKGEEDWGEGVGSGMVVCVQVVKKPPNNGRKLTRKTKNIFTETVVDLVPIFLILTFPQ